MLKRGDIVRVRRPDKFNGRFWTYYYFEAQVMGVIDGYAMVRRPRCGPFVESVRDLKKWTEIEDQPREGS